MKYKPDNYWNEPNIILEIKQLIAIHNKFPSDKFLIKIKRYDLRNAIAKNGGWRYYRALFGFNLETEHRFKHWDNFQNELIHKFPEIRNGHFPKVKDIISVLKCSKRIIDFHGNIEEIAKKLGCEIRNCYKARDGHHPQSSYELILDEYLFSREINHIPHQKIITDRNYKCDQKIDNYFIEIWGFPKGTDSKRIINYNKKRADKEKVYHDSKIKLISFESDLFSKNIVDIENHLDHIFGNLGYDITKRHEFSDNIIKDGWKFSWNDETIIEKLKEIIIKIGKFPTANVLCNYDSKFYYVIGKYGGIKKFGELMGYEYDHQNGYWNDETIHYELEKIINALGYKPKTLIDIKSINSKLYHEMSKRRKKI